MARPAPSFDGVSANNIPRCNQSRLRQVSSTPAPRLQRRTTGQRQPWKPAKIAAAMINAYIKTTPRSHHAPRRASSTTVRCGDFRVRRLYDAADAPSRTRVPAIYGCERRRVRLACFYCVDKCLYRVVGRMGRVDMMTSATAAKESLRGMSPEGAVIFGQIAVALLLISGMGFLVLSLH